MNSESTISLNRQKANMFDKLIVFTITLLTFGWVGGAVQAIRVFSICILPFTFILYLHQKNIFIRRLSVIGIGFLLYALCLTFIYDRMHHWGTLPYVELGYLFLNSHILMALLLFAQRAACPKYSVTVGWMAFVLSTGLIGIWEIATGSHLPTNMNQAELLELGYGINGIFNKVYAAATFGNYNEYVTALCCAIPFLAYKLFCSTELKKFVLPLACLLLSIVIITVNASRGGILCIALAALTYLFYYRRSYFKHKMLYLGVLCLCVGAALYEWGDLLFSQLEERMGVATFGETGRSIIWAKNWAAICECYAMGCGSGAFNSHYVVASHSIIIEILVFYGLPGLITFLWILWIIWRKYRRALTPIRMTLATFFITFIPYSIINSNYLQYAFFWVFMASLLIFATRGKIIEPV